MRARVRVRVRGSLTVTTAVTVTVTVNLTLTLTLTLGDLLGCPSGRDGYSYFGTAPPNRGAPGFKVRRDMTAWKAGVTMYEGGINNAGTLARAIGHSLGLHHAGGEGPKQVRVGLTLKRLGFGLGL